MEHLERARENLRRASEDAPGEVHTQLDSIQEGIFEEEGGNSTQDQPGPKADHIAELVEKLERLRDEVTKEDTEVYIENAIHHLDDYMRDHPEGG